MRGIRKKLEGLTVAGQLETVLADLPDGTVFAGATAAWLHGLAAKPTGPITVFMPPGTNNRRRSGVFYRRTVLLPGDRTVAGGLPVTSVEATLWELARRLPLPDAVAAVDEALNRGLTTLDRVAAWLGRRRRYGGPKLARALALADAGAESPMETRLRVLMVTSRLPAPATQVELFDAGGALIGRVDMFYADASLVIEYDGATHKATIAEDLRRHNRLLEAGYQALRFTYADVVETPSRTVAQVASALRRSTLLAKRAPEPPGPGGLLAKQTPTWRRPGGLLAE